jgi:hypothetical protein
MRNNREKAQKEQEKESFGFGRDSAIVLDPGDLGFAMSLGYLTCPPLRLLKIKEFHDLAF